MVSLILFLAGVGVGAFYNAAILPVVKAVVAWFKSKVQ